MPELKDLKPDPRNRRKHNARNLGMLTDALHQVGAARSIVIDEHNTVLAGGGVVAAAAEAGISKVKVVEADGKTVVAVRRRGLSSEQKRALAIYDNRAAELAEWDADQLADDLEAGLPLQPFFTEAELQKIIGSPDHEPVVKEVQTTEVADRFWISIRGPLKAQAIALQRLRDVMREIEGVVVEVGTIASLEEWT